MSRRLLLGTRNPGKIYEIKLILGDLPLEFSSLNDFPHVEVPVEDADTYAGNAIKKARFYAREAGVLALADDSGLEVEALDGAPGVISHRYAGDEADDAGRRKFLLSKLAETRSDNRRARFVCAIAIATPAGEVVNLCEGICEGMITFEPRGELGFGYDPLFVPDGYEKTFGELSDEVKNQISHRARALLKLRDFLNQ
jgi:XTP/dITP diphosphohydrolase